MPFDSSGSWKPHEKHEEFLRIPDSVKEAAFLGGAGSGKTELLLMFAIARRFIDNPKFKQVFLRRTFPELRNEVVPRSKEIYPKLGATFNKTDMAWTFPSGAMIFLGHCEHEDDVHQYDSMEINLFTPDEITSFTQYIYIYIALTRVRSSDVTLPAIVRTTGMPGGIGHTWVKQRFVDPFPNGGQIIKGKGGIKRIFIHATQADNPHIDQNYKHSLEALPEAEKKAKLYGSFDAYLGQVFTEFRDKRYPGEPENALHVVEPFEIPDWWPKFIVGDWGYEAYTWIGFAAISPQGQCIAYRELVYRRTKIEEWAPFVRELIEKENPRVIRFCKSASQHRGQEHTIQEQISQALGVNVELTDNSPGSRIATKQLLHEYLRWQPKYVRKQDKPVYDDGYASWLLRNRGMKEYESYLKTFEDKPEEVLPKLLIFDTNKFQINAINSCIHSKSNPEDVEEFLGDDAYDGTRYMVDTADRYFQEAKDEFEFVKKRELLLERYAKSNDMHNLYMGARLLDTTQSGPLPVSRYHGRKH